MTQQPIKKFQNQNQNPMVNNLQFDERESCVWIHLRNEKSWVSWETFSSFSVNYFLTLILADSSDEEVVQQRLRAAAQTRPAAAPARRGRRPANQAAQPRGRPRKAPVVPDLSDSESDNQPPQKVRKVKQPTQKQGRPKKIVQPADSSDSRRESMDFFLEPEVILGKS